MKVAKLLQVHESYTACFISNLVLCYVAAGHLFLAGVAALVIHRHFCSTYILM